MIDHRRNLLLPQVGGRFFELVHCRTAARQTGLAVSFKWFRPSPIAVLTVCCPRSDYRSAQVFLAIPFALHVGCFVHSTATIGGR